MLNLRSADGVGFLADEQQHAEIAGQHVHTPVHPTKINHQLTNQLMQHIDGLAKPTLIHCKSGTPAGLIGLIYVARREGMTAAHALETGKQLGLNFDAHPQLKQFIESYISNYQQAS